jgi:hypothetical protein
MAKLRLLRRQHTLIYGMRLLPDEVLPEQSHQRVQVERPDGPAVTLTLHTISGDKEEIRRRLLESVDAFLEIYGEPLP